MLALSLLLLLIGILIGLLANAARARAWGRYGWLGLLVLSALVTLIAGWLGALLLGPSFATPTAIWIAVISVILLPRLISRMRARVHV